jgi:tRNA G10  N-methylase Trm11
MMRYTIATMNPFYAARVQRSRAVHSAKSTSIEKVVIGDATLYRANCFDILPTLTDIDAVVTDPPFGIGFKYRSYDDAPDNYDTLMRRLVPLLNAVTNGGPCFVWQSPLKADQWHKWFPRGYRIIAACKLYPERPGKYTCLSWDPILFWSGNSRLHEELPKDWHVADLRSYDGYLSDNPAPCPRPLSQLDFLCQSIRAQAILDPFMGSGTTGVACIQAGKRFIGIEQDALYFEYACLRIERAYAALKRTAKPGP